MFLSPRSTRIIILFYIIVYNHGDLILDKNLDFYKYFLVYTKPISLIEERLETNLVRFSIIRK